MTEAGGPIEGVGIAPSFAPNDDEFLRRQVADEVGDASLRQREGSGDLTNRRIGMLGQVEESEAVTGHERPGWYGLAVITVFCHVSALPEMATRWHR